MRSNGHDERIRSWIVDYSGARTKAIEWLGDRYLLAKPINRNTAPVRSSAARAPAAVEHR
jgi:hypothetical protein